MATNHDDAHAQDMFDQMHGVPPTNNKRPRNPGSLGGALFVDAAGLFFQRRAPDADALRAEMLQGLPETAVETRGQGHPYDARTSLPIGNWEVRLVEADDITSTIADPIGKLTGKAK